MELVVYRNQDERGLRGQGSMGECLYIVRGKGNPESFMTCSHGAGRTMSRIEARQGNGRRRVPKGHGRYRRNTDGVP